MAKSKRIKLTEQDTGNARLQAILDSPDCPKSLLKLSIRQFLNLSIGATSIVQDPEELVVQIAGYFDWLEANPLYEGKLASYQGDHEVIDIPKMRAATLTGLYQYLGISPNVWSGWKQNRTDLLPVCQWAEMAVANYKFEGAAAGLLQPNIIMRDLGLADKSELSGPGGEPLQTVVQYQLPDNGRGKDEPKDPAAEAETD